MLKRFSSVALVLVLLALTGCSTVSAKPAVEPLAGEYAGSGGGGAINHVQALTGRFRELHPGVIWVLEDVGSDASIRMVAENAVDLGFVSRDLTSDEKGQVTWLPIGAVGTAVAVNSENPVKGLTREQVRKIFAGEITDWSQVGGTGGKIRVLVRERDASTRKSFEEYFFKGAAYTKDAIEVYEIDETLKALYSFRDAIGMVTLSARTADDPRIHLLAVDGAEATTRNVYSGAYPVRRAVHLIYNPDLSGLRPGVIAFLEFVKGPEGRKVLEGI